jgi:hypothetical protein
MKNRKMKIYIIKIGNANKEWIVSGMMTWLRKNGFNGIFNIIYQQLHTILTLMHRSIQNL